MKDAELFNNSFGEWLELHGVSLGGWDDQRKHFKAEIDLNTLKPAIMRYADTKDDPDEDLRGALEDMVWQFGYKFNGKGRTAASISTGGLSALEWAFDVLDWDDPTLCTGR